MTDEHTGHEMVPSEVLDEVEYILEALSAAWATAAQNNSGAHMTLDEMGAIAKHHLRVTALQRSKVAPARRRAAREKK